MKQSKQTLRYSESFKLSVLKDIESNHLSFGQARLKYNIKGGSTIQGWAKKYGNFSLLNRIVMVMPLKKKLAKDCSEDNRKKRKSNDGLQ